MNLTINRSIDNNVFKTTMKFASFGGLDITSEEEQELLQDYPIVLEYNNITFSGKYGLNGKNVIIDETNGDTVSIIIPNKKIVIDESFIAEYAVSSLQVPDSELGEVLTVKENICEAKCLLFEEKIKAAISTLITGIKAKDSDFGKNNPINITI
jgi:hypothetical protein